MKPNPLLNQIARIKMDAFLAGERCGRQETIDALQIMLNRHGYGIKRIVPMSREVMQIMEGFTPAFTRNGEQDVYQEMLDNELIRIARGEIKIIPFHERYPEIGVLGGKPLRGVEPIEFKEKKNE